MACRRTPAAQEGPDYTGVWVQGRKIASIGVHVSRGVSTHGFAVNVDNDLAPFDWVVACGLPDVRMTSLARELPRGRAIDAERFRTRVAQRFAEAHSLRLRPVAQSELLRDMTPRVDARRTRTACEDAEQMPTIPFTPNPVSAGGVRT